MIRVLLDCRQEAGRNFDRAGLCFKGVALHAGHCKCAEGELLQTFEGLCAVVGTDGNRFAGFDVRHGVQILSEEPGAVEPDRSLLLIEQGLCAVGIRAVEVVAAGILREQLGHVRPNCLLTVAVRADRAVEHEALPEADDVVVDVCGIVIVGIGGIVDELAVHFFVVAVVAFLRANDFNLRTGGLIDVNLRQPAHLICPERVEVARNRQRLIARCVQLLANGHELVPGGGRFYADFGKDVGIVEPQNLNAVYGNAIPHAADFVNALHAEFDLIRPRAVGIGTVIVCIIIKIDDLVRAVGARQVAVHDVGFRQCFVVALERGLYPIGIAVGGLQIDNNINIRMLFHISFRDGFPCFLHTCSGVNADGDSAGKSVLFRECAAAQCHHQHEQQTQETCPSLFHFLFSFGGLRWKIGKFSPDLPRLTL